MPISVPIDEMVKKIPPQCNKVIVLTFDEDGQPEHIIGRYNDTASGNTVKSKDYDSLKHGEVVGFRTYEHTHLLSLFESG